MDRGFYSTANIDELFHRRHKFTIAVPSGRKWAEKIKTMETLWDDLCHYNQEDIPSPDWHKQILSERENDIKTGKAHFIYWEQAKKEIKDSIK